MAEMPIIILWTGPKHSGKTTRALDLVESIRKAGFSVAGLLAPSVYNDGQLIGYYAHDLNNASKKPLAEWNSDVSGKRRIQFLSEGLKVGINALSRNSITNADIIIIDEFGKFEMSGRIWRKPLDSILSYSNNIILLVVRHELIEAVTQLYSDIFCEKIEANEPNSIEKIITMLRKRKK
jgi:nucleoside-triphosphatase THEP1